MYYYIVDGHPTAGHVCTSDADEVTVSANEVTDDTLAGIRCCNTAGTAGESYCGDATNPTTGGTTCTAHTFAVAKDTCENTYGGRLCTMQEVLNGVPAGTGCAYDTMYVWTSTKAGEYVGM